GPARGDGCMPPAFGALDAFWARARRGTSQLAIRGRSSSVLPELWDSKPGHSADVYEMRLQHQGGGRSEVQRDHADDESAGSDAASASGGCGASASGAAGSAGAASGGRSDRNAAAAPGGAAAE